MKRVDVRQPITVFGTRALYKKPTPKSRVLFKIVYRYDHILGNGQGYCILRSAERQPLNTLGKGRHQPANQIIKSMIKDEKEKNTRSLTVRTTGWRRFLVAIALMIFVFFVVVDYRNHIRAYLWAYSMRTTNDPAERMNYFARLSTLDECRIPAISPLLSQEDPTLRALAVTLLHGEESSEAIALLVKASEDDEQDIRFQAIRGLAMSSSNVARQQLRKVLLGDRETDAANAAFQLAHTGSPHAASLLPEAVTHANTTAARIEAIFSIKTLTLQAATWSLFEALNDLSAFNGVTMRNQYMFEMLEVASTMPSNQTNILTNHPATRTTNHIVAWEANKALELLTGHSVLSPDEHLDLQTIQERWRKWLRNN